VPSLLSPRRLGIDQFDAQRLHREQWHIHWSRERDDWTIHDHEHRHNRLTCMLAQHPKYIWTLNHGLALQHSDTCCIRWFQLHGCMHYFNSPDSLHLSVRPRSIPALAHGRKIRKPQKSPKLCWTQIAIFWEKPQRNKNTESRTKQSIKSNGSKTASAERSRCDEMARAHAGNANLTFQTTELILQTRTRFHADREMQAKNTSKIVKRRLL
jgi:hypothetical protein